MQVASAHNSKNARCMRFYYYSYLIIAFNKSTYEIHDKVSNQNGEEKKQLKLTSKS